MALTLIDYTANNTEAVQGAYRQSWAGVLTEWDNDDIPKLAGGRVIEVGGAAYLVNGDETIGGTAPSEIGDFYYVSITPAGTTASVSWESTFSGTWDDSNAGYYDDTKLFLPVEVRFKTGPIYEKFHYPVPGCRNISYGHDLSRSVKGTNIFSGNVIDLIGTPTEDDIYDALFPFFSRDDEVIAIRGAGELPNNGFVIPYEMERVNSTRVSLTWLSVGVSAGAISDVNPNLTVLFDSEGGTTTSGIISLHLVIL